MVLTHLKLLLPFTKPLPLFSNLIHKSSSSLSFQNIMTLTALSQQTA